MLKCRNPNCNTWWKNENERDKHENYHCHVTTEEKQYFQEQNIDIHEINRTSNIKFGLPFKNN